MKVNISISENNNLAMWFLGDNPKQLRVALTFANKGPVEIEFDELSPGEQAQILRDLKLAKIVSSVKYESLAQHYLAQHKLTPVDKKKQPLDKQAALLEKIQKHRRKQVKLEERVNYLLKKSTRAIKAALKDEKDTKVLQAFRRAEQAGQSRKLVMFFLNRKISKIQEEIVRKVSKIKPTRPSRKEPIEFNVVDSEEEIIKFSVGEPLTNQA
jgi:hypothetical protein